MSIFETYSKRMKGLPDIYKYDNIPTKLKNQIFHIWNDFFEENDFRIDLKKLTRQYIYKAIKKEEGVKVLFSGGQWTDTDPAYQVEKFFDEISSTDKILDVIEITFYNLKILEEISKETNPYINITYPLSGAINDLNRRFRENGIGYEYVNGKIIRVDNSLLHSGTIQQTLNLLLDPDFKNVNDEFLKAHEHFRSKRNHECLNDCLKAFESTMKIICNKNGWKYKETDTSKSLINILLSNNFLNNYHESHLSAIRQLLEGNVPMIRNKHSGHGSGIKTINIPDFLATYMLYVSGATIRFLVETQQDFKSK